MAESSAQKPVSAQTANQAFVLRIAPSGIDRVPEALAADQIIIGWSKGKGLLNPKLTWDEFREIIQDTFYRKEGNLRKAGSAGGNMWRFIRDMKVGDLVVVPYWSDFYVAEIKGAATYDPSKVQEDTAYRRDVVWMNNKQPISRSLARSALISRMKTQGTSAFASDLIEEITDCLRHSSSGSKPSFKSDLQARLIRETLDEIRCGRMDSFGFERLIQNVLMVLGATETRIVPRLQDKGADILAVFVVAGSIQQILAVQAKHWGPEPAVGPDVVDQLVRGIEAGSADLGMIITSGTISPDAFQAAEKYSEEEGVKIQLLNGEDFAKLIVESGVRGS